MKETKAIEVKKDLPICLLPGEFMFIGKTMYFNLPVKSDNGLISIGVIDNHNVTRNNDNTVTVPFIKTSDSNGDVWNGCIKNNVWKETK